MIGVDWVSFYFGLGFTLQYLNKTIDLQKNHGGLVVRVVVMQTLCSGIESAHIRIFFSFKIEETYTLTTFVKQKLTLSVYSKSTYDILVWLGFFDLAQLLKKISDYRSNSVLKILTRYRPYSRSLYYFPSKFPSVLRGNHTSSIRATSPKFMYHIYQKLNITALQNCHVACFKIFMQNLIQLLN